MGVRARAARRLDTGCSVKLLLDENLSRRLAPALQGRFPGTTQVALAGLQQASDAEIWKFAREHGFAIVTKDDDFSGLQDMHGYPPKLIVLRLGNCNNQQVLETLLASADVLVQLLEQRDTGLIEIG